MRVMKWCGLGLLLWLAGCDNLQLGMPMMVDPKLLVPYEGKFEVVGYLQSEHLSLVSPADLPGVTRVIYFGAGADATGELQVAGIYGDWQKARLASFRHDAHISLSLGVVDFQMDGGLAAIVRDPAASERLITELCRFLASEGFTGVDFDWEYPSDAQLGPYVDFLAKVHAALNPHGWQLSAAVSPSAPLPSRAYSVLDRIHLMTYDDYGQHATYVNTQGHVRRMVENGVPVAKMMMGLPFYGRGYADEHGESWRGAYTFRISSAKYGADPQGDEAAGYFYNGTVTLKKKVQLARLMGLPGVMIWELGQDAPDGVLLRAVVGAADLDSKE